MSFDALTIVGILTSILSGAFLIALVSRNDPGERPGGPPDVAPGAVTGEP